MFSIKIPVLGFLWEKEEVPMPATCCLSSIILPKSAYPAALVFCPSSFLLRSSSCLWEQRSCKHEQAQDKYLHDLYYGKQPLCDRVELQTD